MLPLKAVPSSSTLYSGGNYDGHPTLEGVELDDGFCRAQQGLAHVKDEHALGTYALKHPENADIILSGEILVVPNIMERRARGHGLSKPRSRK